MSTRRHFLHSSSLAAGLALVPPAWLHARPYTPFLIRATSRRGEPDLPALAAHAVDAARRAGATYADARITYTRFEIPGSYDAEDRAIGVRALVNGYWGFVSSATWTPDEAVRLARGAIAQATAHSRGKTRHVELGPAPSVQHGEWAMPVTYDPFEVPAGEKLDVMNAFMDHASHNEAGIFANGTMSFSRQLRHFASSDDASWTQTRYESTATFTVSCRDEYHARLDRGAASADWLTSAGRGWEHVLDSGLMEAVPRLVEQAKESRHVTTLDVGRYDMVFSAQAMATMIDRTLGMATELDRALGYEANAGGTSYLGDPLDILGTALVSSPLVTVVANRSLRGGLATVAWDDEGMVPEECPLVAKGILVDYQTTREQAAWLAPYYTRVGRPVRSHGFAGANSALDITMQRSPNLAMLPGTSPTTFEDLVASTNNGIAVLDFAVDMDQQGLNGYGGGRMREIKHGKLGRYLEGGAVLFRAPEFWKSLVAIGGPGTQRWFGSSSGKGQPRQSTSYSVGAVPAKVTQVTVIDPRRKG